MSLFTAVFSTTVFKGVFRYTKDLQNNWENLYFYFLALFSTVIVLIINRIKIVSLMERMIVLVIMSFFLVVIAFIVHRLFQQTAVNSVNREISPFLSKEDNPRLHENNKAFSIILFVVILIIIAGRSIVTILIPFMNAQSIIGRQLELEGVVISDLGEINTQSVFSNAFLNFGDQQVNSEPADSGQSILVRTRYGLTTVYCNSSNLNYGDRLNMYLNFSEPSPKRNPGGFDEKGYYYSNGIYFKSSLVNAVQPRVIGKEPNPVYRAAYALKARVVRTYIRNLPKRDAALMSGLLLGDRSMMTAEDIQIYKKAGLSHITAVSGSAITFLMIPIQFILQYFKIAKRYKTIIIISIMLFFGFVTGWAPSITRALWMLFLVIFAKSIHRKINMIQSLLVVVTALLVFHPLYAINPGFWLSSLATAGIVRLSNPLQISMSRNNSKRNIVASAIATSLAASLPSVPIVIWLSSEISISSILSGILVLPVVEFATILGSVEAVIGLFKESSVVTALLAVPLKGLLYFIFKIAQLVSTMNILHFKTINLSFLIPVSILFFLIYLFTVNINIKKKCLVFATCIFVTGMIHTSMKFVLRPEMQVVFADVGQGDATLIMLKTGESVLIDSGGEKKGFPVISQMLDYYGIDHPSIYVITHTHEDHCGGLVKLIKDRGGGLLVLPDTISIIDDSSDGDKTSNSIIMPVSENSKTNGESDISCSLLNTAKSSHIEIRQAGSGDSIKVGKTLMLNILAPEKSSIYKNPPSDEKNNNAVDKAKIDGNESSLIIRVEYGTQKILIMGDATGDAEKKLVESGVSLQANILRISHHGSPTSTNHDIISAVAPVVSIISVGVNFYGHPSPKVINRLEQAQSTVYRTDYNGAVLVDVFMNVMRVKTMILQGVR